jgi:hypothetical protein
MKIQIAFVEIEAERAIVSPIEAYFARARERAHSIEAIGAVHSILVTCTSVLVMGQAFVNIKAVSPVALITRPARAFKRSISIRTIRSW